MQAPRFVVYSRADCPLCEEFIAALSEQLAPHELRIEVRDVDADPVSRRRYGLKVPVLTVDGSAICHGELDAAAVARMLRR